MNLAWIMKPGWFGLPSGENLSPAQATLPARLAFLSVAVWWLVFSIPLFRRVSEPPAAARRPRDRLSHPGRIRASDGQPAADCVATAKRSSCCSRS